MKNLRSKRSFKDDDPAAHSQNLNPDTRVYISNLDIVNFFDNQKKMNKLSGESKKTFKTKGKQVIKREKYIKKVRIADS
jgi:hypothetical protein